MQDTRGVPVSAACVEMGTCFLCKGVLVCVRAGRFEALLLLLSLLPSVCGCSVLQPLSVCPFLPLCLSVCLSVGYVVCLQPQTGSAIAA
uniref:Uncharacterized protein n=1 Tax=Anguilla anguilla TaxID=7936 RepID=A0A0E9X580_ANGAN